MQTLPRVSIVTPNYNGAEYLEPTIASVLAQNYPNLEYIVIDGGSTDESVEVIRRYEPHLAYWTTRPDKGQYAAINEGFARSTGEVLAWLNSDDMYLPGALSAVGEVFGQHPEVEWLTSTMPAVWNEQGQAVLVSDLQGFNRDSFFRGANGPHSKQGGFNVYSRGYIEQESTFWRRSLWERAGAHLDTSVTLAADFELWARFYQHAELYGIRALLGGFRFREGQSTDRRAEQYREQCLDVLQRYGGKQYGKTHAWFRRYLAGRILPVLKRMPRATSLGLVFPAKVWVHTGRGGTWALTTKLVV